MRFVDVSWASYTQSFHHCLRAAERRCVVGEIPMAMFGALGDRVRFGVLRLSNISLLPLMKFLF